MMIPNKRPGQDPGNVLVPDEEMEAGPVPGQAVGAGDIQSRIAALTPEEMQTLSSEVSPELGAVLQKVLGPDLAASLQSFGSSDGPATAPAPGGPKTGLAAIGSR